MEEFKLHISFFGDDLFAGVGDSNGLGLATRLQMDIMKKEPEATCYNLGIKGETTDKLIERFEQEMLPRLVPGADNRVVFCIGHNDCLVHDNKQAVSVKETIENAKSLILAAKGKVRLFFIGPPSVYDPQIDARVKKWNQWLAELCKQTRIPYISLYNATSKDAQYKRSLTGVYRISPDDQGYEKLISQIIYDRVWWYSE